MQETVADYWRMVWEHDVHSVVMMTKLEENGEVWVSTSWQIITKNTSIKIPFEKLPKRMQSHDPCKILLKSVEKGMKTWSFKLNFNRLTEQLF